MWALVEGLLHCDVVLKRYGEFRVSARLDCGAQWFDQMLGNLDVGIKTVFRYDEHLQSVGFK